LVWELLHIKYISSFNVLSCDLHQEDTPLKLTLKHIPWALNLTPMPLMLIPLKPTLPNQPIPKPHLLTHKVHLQLMGQLLIHILPLPHPLVQLDHLLLVALSPLVYHINDNYVQK
jgi:hypothetical protein